MISYILADPDNSNFVIDIKGIVSQISSHQMSPVDKDLKLKSAKNLASRLIFNGGNMGYLYLSIAIIAEVIATTALKASESFTKIYPSTVVIVGYAVSFYLFSHVLKTIPVGIAYAIWAGIGIAVVTIAGAFLYRQVPDVPAIIGIGFIVIGVVVINVYSKTVGL